MTAVRRNEAGKIQFQALLSLVYTVHADAERGIDQSVSALCLFILYIAE